MSRKSFSKTLSLLLMAVFLFPTYVHSQANRNKNVSNEGDGAALALETPRLNPDNLFVAHYVSTTAGRKLNYSLEWNAKMRHAQWVAYKIDRTTIPQNVKRCNCFDVDPLLPENMRIDNSFHKSDGFDRGHLCRSADRLASMQENRQTFYFSNMSPQINSFNAGIWQKIENEVGYWGSLISSGKYDALYVVKGGTLDKRLINFSGTQKHPDGTYPTTDNNGFTVRKLACPAFYFMAILAVKDGNFSAIAFYVPHAECSKKRYSVAEAKNFVVTVDELEQLTGIDFFCNLPDIVESAVESVADVSEWKWQ